MGNVLNMGRWRRRGWMIVMIIFCCMTNVYALLKTVTAKVFKENSIDKLVDIACECFHQIPSAVDDSDAIALFFVSCITKDTAILYDALKEYGPDKMKILLIEKINKTCPKDYAEMNNRMSNSNNVNKITDSASCRIMRKGRFMTLEKTGGVMTIDGNEMREDDAENNNHTTSTIRWINDCEFTSTLVESNNPNVNKTSKTGDELHYFILSVEGNIIRALIKFKGLQFQVKFTKLQ